MKAGRRSYCRAYSFSRVLILAALLFGGVFRVYVYSQPATTMAPSLPIRPAVPPFTPVPTYPYQEYDQTGYMPAVATQQSDPDLRRNIVNRMATDTFLRPFGIHVTVRNGMAILNGNADTWQDYSRAEADAYAAGAPVVINGLRVRFP